MSLTHVEKLSVESFQRNVPGIQIWWQYSIHTIAGNMEIFISNNTNDKTNQVIMTSSPEEEEYSMDSSPNVVPDLNQWL